MSDREIRTGLRALFAAGMDVLSDDEIAQLVNGGTATQQKRKTVNVADKLEYLEKFVAITDRRMDSGDTYTAREELKALNKEYNHLGESVLRTEIQAVALESEGWIASSYMC